MILSINSTFNIHSSSYSNKENIRRKIQKTTLDLPVIGSGITGAGIALDVISTGIKVALIKKNDFTSNKSTELIYEVYVT